MAISSVIPQIRTTNLEQSIDFYVNKLGLELEFRFQDFYAGIRAGTGRLHLKLVDDPDPSIDFVRQGDHLHLYFPTRDAARLAQTLKSRGVSLLTEPHSTDYTTSEFSILDDQGHTLFFSQSDE